MQAILNHRLLSTRGGTAALGVLAAVVAGLFVLVYLNQYRNSVKASSGPVTVLVAKKLIPKGTPGSYVGNANLFVPTKVPESKAIEGAISDPVAFRGRVAVADIFPGQQMTTSDFSITATSVLSAQLVRSQRAVAIPLDSAHGLTGQIGPGDHVDIFVGFNANRGSVTKPVLKLLMPNALVLASPGAKSGLGGTPSSSNLIVRADYQHAAEIAFAVDNGKLWAVLRPAANVRATPPEMVTIESILFGVKPVTVQRKLRDFLAAG
jgi:Flp pilus assembly protein CpaB